MRWKKAQKSRKETSMKPGFRKSNFLILFLLFITFSSLLFQNAEFNAALMIYLLFGAAVFDICLDVKYRDRRMLRSVCWIVLNAMIGTALSVYIFQQKDMSSTVNKFLFGTMILWTAFTTCSCGFLILRVYRTDGEHSEKK